MYPDLWHAISGRIPEEEASLVRGFRVERKSKKNPKWLDVSGTIPGKVFKGVGYAYNFTDKSVRQDDPYVNYRVVVVDPGRGDRISVEQEVKRLAYPGTPGRPRNLTGEVYRNDGKLYLKFGWDPAENAKEPIVGYYMISAAQSLKESDSHRGFPLRDADALDGGRKMIWKDTAAEFEIRDDLMTAWRGKKVVFCVAGQSQKSDMILGENSKPFTLFIPRLKLDKPSIDNRLKPLNERQTKFRITWSHPGGPELKGFRVYDREKKLVSGDELLKPDVREWVHDLGDDYPTRAVRFYVEAIGVSHFGEPMSATGERGYLRPKSLTDKPK
jgi:hypothetical protein